MSRYAVLKGALLVVLAAAAIAGRAGLSPWLVGGLLAFGAFNLLIAAPGTEWIRASAVGGSAAALLSAAWSRGSS